MQTGFSKSWYFNFSKFRSFQTKYTYRLFPRSPSCREKTPSCRRGHFYLQFYMVNTISDDKLVKNKQINIIIRIVTYLVIHKLKNKIKKVFDNKISKKVWRYKTPVFKTQRLNHFGVLHTKNCFLPQSSAINSQVCCVPSSNNILTYGIQNKWK